MRIAQVSPLAEAVPPSGYGGTERVVSYLTEELVAMGHEVTLFAAGDSRSTARMVPCAPRALRLDPSIRDTIPYHLLMLDEVERRAADFDVVHFHIDYLSFPLSRRLSTACLTTHHGRLDVPDLLPIYRAYSDLPVVSISESQREALPEANWVATVYHGLPETRYEASEQHEGYLLFLGRFAQEKRPEVAIELALATGMKLKIAAKVAEDQPQFFEEVIRPKLNHPLIEYVGEVAGEEKARLLRGAAALLFPITWPEPFGMVMIEAMATGTPVIARRRGSVPEVMEPPATGVVYETFDEACQAIRSLESLSRRATRQVFERRFTARRMAEDYLSVYASLVRQQ